MQAYPAPLGAQSASSFVQSSGFYPGSYFPTQTPNYGRSKDPTSAYLGYTPSYYGKKLGFKYSAQLSPSLFNK